MNAVVERFGDQEVGGGVVAREERGKPQPSPANTTASSSAAFTPVFPSSTTTRAFSFAV